MTDLPPEWQAALAAFAQTDLGQALSRASEAIHALEKELRKREHDPAAEDVRRRWAAWSIAHDVLQDRDFSTRSAAELELLRIVSALWRAATARDPKDSVAEAVVQAELAGLMIPTYEQEQTASGALANVWATAGKRH